MLIWKFNRCWQLLAILSFKKCLNNNRKKNTDFSRQWRTICVLKKKAENAWERINAQQYPAFIWTPSLRMWDTAVDYTFFLNLWGFRNIFSCLCPHHLQTGLFQLSNHKWASEAEKLWWWSSLWVSKTILFNLFEKAAEVLISVFIKRKPFLGQLNPASICVEIQTHSSGWDEEQAQHPIPQPGMLPKNQLQVTNTFLTGQEGGISTWPCATASHVFMYFPWLASFRNYQVLTMGDSPLRIMLMVLIYSLHRDCFLSGNTLPREVYVKLPQRKAAPEEVVGKRFSLPLSFWGQCLASALNGQFGHWTCSF